MKSLLPTEPETTLPTAEVFIDVSWDPMSGVGGCAFLLRRGLRERRTQGAEGRTSTFRLSLRAIVEALQALGDVPHQVTVRSGEQLLVNCLNGSMATWAGHNWCKNKSGTKPVKHADLWKVAYMLTKLHRCTFIFDNTESPEKAICDRMARNALQANRTALASVGEPQEVEEEASLF